MTEMTAKPAGIRESMKTRDSVMVTMLVWKARYQGTNNNLVNNSQSWFTVKITVFESDPQLFK